MKLTTLAGFSCWCPMAIALILLSLPVSLRASSPLQSAMQHQITGAVTDSNGKPLGGVNIIVSGKGQGTISDFDGTYSITASPRDTLVYSFVGFKTWKERVGEQLAINVVLHEDVTALGEVTVNAGYYTVSEKERTGSISRITSKDIEKQPVSNPLAAMQSRMSGVDIRQSTGVPGGGFSVQIRGQNSIRPEGNYPLYIIDGVPVSSEPLSSYGGLFPASIGIDPLNTLNPGHIESIEVLKDADATAIYGSRGANGVVLITTKKGKEGKTGVELSIQGGLGSVSGTMRLLNTRQYVQMRREAFTFDGVKPTIATAPDLLLWEQGRYTDWQKELTGGTAYITEYRATVSGGNPQTSFLLGGGYRKETTVFPGDFGNDKITGHVQLNHRSENQKFRLSFSLNYGRDTYHLFNSNRFMENALILPPNAPELYDEEGELNWAFSPDGTPTFDNPAAALYNSQDMVTRNLVSNVVLHYEIHPGWTLKTSLGYTDLRQEETIIQPKSGMNPVYQDIQLSGTTLLNHNQTSWIVEPQLIYHRDFKTSGLDIQIGATWQKNMGQTRGISGRGYESDALLGNLNGASQVTTLQDMERTYCYQAVFGRIGYQLKKRYLLNLTGRRDGSSRFGPGRRFSSFGAVGMAWVFFREPFMERHLPFISFGKLRGSYGTTGSDQIGDYGYLDTYRPVSGNYRGDGGLYPTRLANPDYGWEMNRKLEAALELGFFQDRARFSASWFRHRTTNQLVGYRLPAIAGFTSVQANLPATVQNTGWELEMVTRNIQFRNLNWTTSLNLTIPRNKLLKYPEIEKSSYARCMKWENPCISGNFMLLMVWIRRPACTVHRMSMAMAFLTRKTG